MDEHDLDTLAQLDPELPVTDPAATRLADLLRQLVPDTAALA